MTACLLADNIIYSIAHNQAAVNIHKFITVIDSPNLDKYYYYML